MQRLSEIKELLKRASTRPQKRFGQNFLIDLNLMGKLLELADIQPGQTVLEVGPATGSLTEELLERAGRVVAVELDRPLAGLLADRLAGEAALQVICGDVLAGKHELSPQVIDAVAPGGSLVANLPYNIATPLVALCLRESWRALTGSGKCTFDSLTFTVQAEVAQRLCSSPGTKTYGQISVLVGLLGNAQLGHMLPPTSFWPQPKVNSQMVRIDFDPTRAAKIGNLDALQTILRLTFTQRRKTIGAILRRKTSPFSREQADRAIESAGIDPMSRPEQLTGEQFLALTEALPESGLEVTV